MDTIISLIKQGLDVSDPPQIFIRMLIYAARYVAAEEDAPDWVKLLAGGNPDLGEELLDEVRRWERVEGIESNAIPTLRDAEPFELRLVHSETGRIAIVRWSWARWWDDSGWEVYIQSGDRLVAYLFKEDIRPADQVLEYLHTRGYLGA
jgi:hypothetical protein